MAVHPVKNVYKEKLSKNKFLFVKVLKLADVHPVILPVMPSKNEIINLFQCGIKELSQIIEIIKHIKELFKFGGLR